MLPRRPLTIHALALCCLLGACGDRAEIELATEPAAAAAAVPVESATDADDWGLLRTVVSEDDVAILAELSVDGPAGPVPDPDTHFPIEGPRGFALFPVGEGRGFYEYTHNEHWGIAALYLYDAQMRLRQFEVPPVLNVWCEEESLALEPSRESFEEVEDGGWHFEDDALLGYPESGRFRFVVDGRTYLPSFAHVHVGHDSVNEHAGEHATGPHVHPLGPNRGYILTLGAHLAHVEVVHKPHWGILGIFVYDAAMEPRELDEAPVLNIIDDEVPLQLTARLEDWHGNEDGGWHFEEDALLGETGPARFRLTLDGKTYTPRFTYYKHGEEPGHSHASDDGTGGH